MYCNIFIIFKLLIFTFYKQQSCLVCTGLLAVAVVGLLPTVAALCGAGSRRTVFGSRGSQAPELRLSSCEAWAYLLLGIWNLPGPGIKPVSRLWQADSSPLRH